MKLLFSSLCVSLVIGACSDHRPPNQTAKGVTMPSMYELTQSTNQKEGNTKPFSIHAAFVEVLGRKKPP